MKTIIGIIAASCLWITNAFSQNQLAGSLTINNTGGAGFLQIANQSGTPSTPTSAGRIYFDGSNRLSFVGTGGLGVSAINLNSITSSSATALALNGNGNVTINTTNGATLAATFSGANTSLAGTLSSGAITANSLTSNSTVDLTLTGNSGTVLTLGNGGTGVAKFIVAASTPHLKVSNVGQSGGAIVFGDGSTAAFNVGVGRITSAQASGGGGLGYFSQGAGNAGGHYWYVGDFAFGSNVEAMRLTTGLNLLIGTTSDLSGVAGGLRTSATGASVSASNTTTGQVRFHDTSGDVGIGGGNIYVSGSLVAGTLNSSGDLTLGVGSAASNFVRVNGPVYSSIISTGTLTHEFTNNSNTASAAIELKLSTAGTSSNGAWLNITDSGALNWITGTLRTQGYFVLGSNGDLSSATNHGIRIDSTHNVTIPNGNLTVSGSLTTGAPTSGTAAPWKFGSYVVAEPTGPVGYLQLDVSGTAYQVPTGSTAQVFFGRVTAQTGATSTIKQITVGASDASYTISANINVTASVTNSFTCTCTYTDETNTSRVLTLTFSNLTGTLLQTITNVTGTGAYEGVPLHIRAKAATTITIGTTGTFTSVTYNAEGAIDQIN